MEWFKHWFNSKEYLNVYRHRDEKEAGELVSLILKNTNICSGSKVLDMAAGSGRHALILAKKNFEVTAVDLSETLLSIARKKAAEEKLNIKFINSDIRKFTTTDKFNLILNLFTSFGYFENDEENFGVLEKAYQLLEMNGSFVLDYLNKSYVKVHLNPVTEEKYEDTKITQNRYIAGNRIVKEILIEKGGEVKKYLESVRMYSRSELIEIFREIGYTVQSTFGDFRGGEFKLETSPRIIIIAGK